MNKQQIIQEFQTQKNEYGITFNAICFSCQKGFDKMTYKNESESESGYGSCPHCGSQFHSGNFPEEIET